MSSFNLKDNRQKTEIGIKFISDPLLLTNSSNDVETQMAIPAPFYIFLQDVKKKLTTFVDSPIEFNDRDEVEIGRHKAYAVTKDLNDTEKQITTTLVDESLEKIGIQSAEQRKFIIAFILQNRFAWSFEINGTLSSMMVEAANPTPAMLKSPEISLSIDYIKESNTVVIKTSGPIEYYNKEIMITIGRADTEIQINKDREIQLNKTDLFFNLDNSESNTNVIRKIINLCRPEANYLLEMYYIAPNIGKKYLEHSVKNKDFYQEEHFNQILSDLYKEIQDDNSLNSSTKNKAQLLHFIIKMERYTKHIPVDNKFLIRLLEKQTEILRDRVHLGDRILGEPLDSITENAYRAAFKSEKRGLSQEFEKGLPIPASSNKLKQNFFQRNTFSLALLLVPIVNVFALGKIIYDVVKISGMKAAYNSKLQENEEKTRDFIDGLEQSLKDANQSIMQKCKPKLNSPYAYRSLQRIFGSELGDENTLSTENTPQQESTGAVQPEPEIDEISNTKPGLGNK